MRALLRSLRPEETIVLILQGIKDQSGEVRQDAMEALRTYAAAAASTALDCTQAQAEHALRALRSWWCLVSTARASLSFRPAWAMPTPLFERKPWMPSASLSRRM